MTEPVAASQHWSHDGYPLTAPRCAQCHKFRRPLVHRWGTGWICRNCFKTTPFGHYRRGSITACGISLNNNPAIGVPTTRVRGEVTCAQCLRDA